MKDHNYYRHGPLHFIEIERLDGTKSIIQVSDIREVRKGEHRVYINHIGIAGLETVVIKNSYEEIRDKLLNS